MKKETDRCSFPQNLFDPLQKKAYLCSINTGGAA